MIEAMGLKIIASRTPLSIITSVPNHENLSSGSKVISGGNKDRQTVILNGRGHL
jgi:hypothetical protein